MAIPALIVDDDGGVRGLLRAVLGRRGIECEFAADGMEALDKVVSREYCAVVLDLMMPYVDGYAVMQRLAEVKPDLPVIVMTANVLGGLAGVDGSRVTAVLRKPFQISELEAAIAQTLCEPRLLEAS
jgi:CheY-like chemotaxis protein